MNKIEVKGTSIMAASCGVDVDVQRLQGKQP
jgi:hypothetical protein